MRKVIVGAVGAALAAGGLLVLSAPGGAGLATPEVFDVCGTETTIVPAGATLATIEASGGQGADGIQFDGTEPPGGLGGTTVASVLVQPGEELQVNVGCQGEQGNGGTGGAGGRGGNDDANGGAGGTNDPGDASCNAGSGGGGASDVRRADGTLASRLVVGGGGGGGGVSTTLGLGDGGAGGGESGDDGANGRTAGVPPETVTGGGGGTQSAPGDGGVSYSVINGLPGDGPVGGEGGNVSDAGSISGACGGGGGGGYFGGGGGASDPSNNDTGGGGGGSGFAAADATGVVFSNGTQEGDGLVVITWGVAPPTPGPDVIVANPTFTG